jgi:hypothetical protein
MFEKKQTIMATFFIADLFPRKHFLSNYLTVDFATHLLMNKCACSFWDRWHENSRMYTYHSFFYSKTTI